MMQKCDSNYWESAPNILKRNGDPDNPGQPCGKPFDDAKQSTICPHEEL